MLTRLSFVMTLLWSPLAMADTLRIDTLTPPSQLDWRFISDQVMGGVSEGQASLVGDTLRLTGTVSTENNGGFLQARIQVDGLADLSGLTVTASGNDQTYYIHLRTSRTLLPWHYYQAAFDVTSTPQTLRIPLSAFKASNNALPATPDAATIRSIAVVAYGRDHQADLSVSALGLY